MIFILIMDGFIRIMHMAEQNGYINGFAFSPMAKTTHSLFVDDMLLFGSLIKNHWFYIHFMLIKFGSATGLCMNNHKSILIFEYGSMEYILFIAEFLGFYHRRSIEGLKYLEVYIKPCNYRNRD